MLELSWMRIIRKEFEKTESLPDEVEKRTRHQLIEAILDKISEYNYHLFEYSYSQKRNEISNRGVLFVPTPNSRTIKANWSKLFAASLSLDEKSEIGYQSFKWHIFSFNKVNALSNSKARHAFNQCKKEKVFVFYQNKDEVFYIENPNLLKSSDFDLDQDIYIYDALKKWTYVHTHEAQCGPYFYQIK